MATFQPEACNARAMAAPTRLAAPVTRTTGVPLSLLGLMLKYPSSVENIIETIVLGIVEGITEFLPISSTGHLLIAEHWLGRRSDLFNIAIQAGAILAVALVYRQRLWQLARGLRDRATFDYAAKIAVAFAVTAAVGLPVRKLGWELPETVAPIAWALVIGGVAMLAIERFVERRAAA